MNDTNSTGMMTGISHNGAPCGTNSEKNLKPCLNSPTASTMPNDRNARIAVSVMWLVTAKVCSPGTIASGKTPIRFANRMKKNKEKMYGANFLPPLPMLVLTMLSMKLTALSAITCQRPGTNWRFRPPDMNRASSMKTTIMKNAELVNDTS